MPANAPHEKPLHLDMGFDEALERFAQVNTRDSESLAIADEPAPYVAGEASPFIKWAGGKRHLIEAIRKRLPPKASKYWEPFVGGGAVYFGLLDIIEEAHLSDIILDLVFAYAVIKKDPEPLIEALEKHAKKHNKDYYYRVRNRHELQDPIEIAARIMYLNKTCYNGLYRVNKRGEFNVPMGSYVKPSIVQADNLRACHDALQKASIEFRQFDTITPLPGDFVYCDPPYDPLSETASFTGYTNASFTQSDQIRLRDFVRELHRKGVHVMVSNSDTPFIRDLYSDRLFNLEVVKMPRNVNSKGDRRHPVNELLITTY